MAIIYSYPDKSSPSLSDKIIITDVESTPANQTKRCTIQNLADAISGQFTLQEVLQAGSFATGETGGAWSGNMSLQSSANTVLPQIKRRFIVDVNGLTGSGSDKTAYLVGDLEIAGNGAADAGDIDAAGSLELGGSATVGTSLTVATTSTLNGKTTIGSVASITGNPDLKVGNSIKFGGGIGSGSAFTIGSGYDGIGGNPSDFTGPSIQFASSALSILNKGTGAITIGRATTPASSGIISIGDGNTTQLKLESTDTGGNIDIDASDGITIDNTTTGDIVIENSANPGQIKLRPFFGNEIVLDGRTNAESYIDFKADNGIRLNGVSGSAGELIQSQGAGLPLVWAGPDDLEVLSAKKVVVNATTSTGPIAIGDPLYISGAKSGNRFTVSKADASDPVKMPVVGLAAEAVTGASGNFTMIVNGDLSIDTGTIGGAPTLNRVVYVASGGGLTSSRPIGATDLVQNVGIVSETGSNGAIKVSAIGRTNDTPNIIYSTKQFQVTDNRGINNTTFGFGAFANAGAAQDCVAIGVNAGQAITDALSSSNVAIGKFSMDGSNVGVKNIAIGVGTLGNTNAQTASNNIAIGDNALNSLTTASNNTFVGENSGFSVSTGNLNTGIGRSALSQVSTGQSNVALGYNTGNTVTGNSNTIIGSEANAIAGTDGNIFIGQGALGLTGQGDSNIVIGTGSSTEGEKNIVIGDNLTFSSTTVQQSNKSIVIGSYIDAQNGASFSGIGGSITIGTGEPTTGQTLNNFAQNGIHIGSTATTNLGLTVNAAGSIGIGSSVSIDSNNAIAMGPGATINSTSREAIAIGSQANIATGGRDGIAIGQLTSVTGFGGIAIGLISSSAQNGISVGNGAVAANGVAIGAAAGTAPSGSVGDAIMIGESCGSGDTDGIAIGNGAEVGAHASGIAIGTAAKTAAANDIALGGIDMTTLGAPAGVGVGGTLGIGVRETGTPASGSFQSQAPVAQIPVKYPDATGNLVTGHIYIYP